MSANPPSPGNTDDAWRAWGEKDPYFGVITQPKFRRDKLTPEALEQFFRSGKKHVNHVMTMVRRYIQPGFAPARTLDFGCGVGRLLPAFAAESGEVVGVDISEAMLAEARLNCDRLGVANVQLAPSDDTLSRVEGAFDLVHSVIVLQHIPPERGRAIFAELVRRVRPGGVGALHLTYAKAVFADNFGAPPPPPPEPVAPPVASGLVRLLRRAVPPPPPATPAGAAAADPEMQMNVYPMNDILFILQRAGVLRFHVDFSDHGGELGLTLYFGVP